MEAPDTAISTATLPAQIQRQTVVEEAISKNEKLKKVARGWESQHEEHHYEMEVEGKLPKDLKGTLYRNGPGLMDIYGTPIVHPFDGDGKICSVRFKDGKAVFTSKFVNTDARFKELKEGRMLAKGLMGSFPPKSWTERAMEWVQDITKKKLPNIRFKNVSNTNVFYWGEKLLSCWELGLPYSLDPETLETLGKENLDGLLPGNMGAHFRYDPTTNRLITFSLKQPSFWGPTTVSFYEFDDKFHLVPPQPVECQVHTEFSGHDFAVTECYYIVHQTPFVDASLTYFLKVVTGWAAPGQMMKFHDHIPSRLLLIPRNSGINNVQPLFFDILPCHIFHYVNAYEENDTVKLTCICFDKKMTLEFENHVWYGMKFYFDCHRLGNSTNSPGFLHDITLNLKDRKATWVQSDSSSCEFPTTHPNVTGKPWRYTFLMASELPNPGIPFQELIKIDRMDPSNRRVWSARGEGGVIGEPVFAPRVCSENSNNKDSIVEDDGYLITQLYHYETHTSEFVVIDAKKVEEGPVCRLKLNHHTPYGFHGTFRCEQ